MCASDCEYNKVAAVANQFKQDYHHRGVVMKRFRLYFALILVMGGWGCADNSESTVDLCPEDPDKVLPGLCGCGTPDVDINANEIPDCFESEPAVCADAKCEIGDRKCSGNFILSCREDYEHCPVWTVEEECAGWCHPDNLTCETCEGEVCTPGDKRCDQNKILECRTDSNGCTLWAGIRTCDATKEHCDDSDFTCKLGCTDQCKENETKCGQSVDEGGNESIGTQRCVLDEATGCTTWVSDVTCSDGQTCREADASNPNDTAKCVYTCGESESEDCKPFSLIILPDTQYYAASSKCKIGQDGELPDECIYKKQTQWIADHKTDENIKFVMHMGDLVNGNVAEQYVSAVKAHQILADYGVPYSVATGNHEYGYLNNYYGSRYRNSTLFYQYFNAV